MTRTEDPKLKQKESVMRGRSIGRELAIQLLYMLDVRGKEDVDAQVEAFFRRESSPPDSQVFARQLYNGVSVATEELDDKIVEIATNWDITRMAHLDKAVLRMGVYELLNCSDIPPKVTISEGIELAKKYSTEKSSSFVNGILDKVYQTCCPDKE